MKNIDGPKHTCCPKEWRRIPQVTGDYDFDASLVRNSNKDMRQRLQIYIVKSGGYGPRTDYTGYRGYDGDD